MLTIAKHQVKDYVKPEDLIEVLGKLKKELPQLKTFEYCMELSPKYKQLHLHILCSNPKRIYYKDFCSRGGYRLQWSPQFDRTKVLSYIRKDARDTHHQQAILFQNLFNNEYMFKQPIV